MKKLIPLSELWVVPLGGVGHQYTKYQRHKYRLQPLCHSVWHLCEHECSRPAKRRKYLSKLHKYKEIRACSTSQLEGIMA